MDDLEGLLRPSDALDSSAVNLVVDDEAGRYQLAESIEAVLAAAPSATEVAVWLHQTYIGVAERAAVEALVAGNQADPVKAHGDSAFADLTERTTPTALKTYCPVCNTEFWVASFDESAPPQCPTDHRPLRRRR